MINQFRSLFLTIAFLILLRAVDLSAQQKYNFKQYGDETLEFIKCPVKWNLGDWSVVAGIAAGTFLTMQIDETARDFMLQDRSYANSIPMLFGTYCGEPFTPVVLGGLLLALGSARDNEPNKKLGFEILQASFYSVALTSLIKVSFGRARPSTRLDAFNFSPFSFKDDEYFSLSSGHTSIAFSISTVLAGNTKNDFLKVLSFVPAFITGFSRVYHNRHWVSDVVAGAFIGYFTGRFVLDLHDKEKEIIQASPPPQMLNIAIGF